MTNRAKTNNLNYSIDSAFTNVNRLFVLSFEYENERTCLGILHQLLK